MHIPVTLRINGEDHDMAVDGGDTLLSVLRDRLFLTGAKCGCNQGACGACTVLADRRPVRACLTLAADCDAVEIATVEGLETGGALSVVQRALAASGAVQCGFCSPGMAMATTALLEANPRPTVAEIREGLSGNLCRCSGYAKLVEAVSRAAEGQES